MSTTPESGAVPRPLTPNAMAELLSSRLRVARFRFDAPLSLKKNEVSVGCFEALIVAVQVCGLEARAAANSRDCQVYHHILDVPMTWQVVAGWRSRWQHALRNNSPRILHAPLRHNAALARGALQCSRTVRVSGDTSATRQCPGINGAILTSCA